MDKSGKRYTLTADDHPHLRVDPNVISDIANDISLIPGTTGTPLAG